MERRGKGKKRSNRSSIAPSVPFYQKILLERTQDEPRAREKMREHRVYKTKGKLDDLARKWVWHEKGETKVSPPSKAHWHKLHCPTMVGSTKSPTSPNLKWLSLHANGAGGRGGGRGEAGAHDSKLQEMRLPFLPPPPLHPLHPLKPR